MPTDSPFTSFWRGVNAARRIYLGWPELAYGEARDLWMIEQRNTPSVPPADMRGSAWPCSNRSPWSRPACICPPDTECRCIAGAL